MTKTLLVFFIMFATLIKMPMAIPYIHTRQEIWGNIEWGGLIENTINTLGTLGTGVGNFFQDPNLSDSSAIQKKQGAGPLNELDIENNPPQAPSDVPIGGPGFTGTGLAGGDDCDPTQVNAGCGVATDQLVFTSSCAHIEPGQVATEEVKAQNQVIQDELTAMVEKNKRAAMTGLGLRISTSTLCDVIFFAGQLTPAQIETAKKLPGVEAIVPNQSIELGDSSSTSEHDIQDPVGAPLPFKRSHLEKRDRVIRDSAAFEDLRFISTPPKVPVLSNDYSYYDYAGGGVVVIMIDAGVNILHEEFKSRPRPVIQHYIYALDTSQEPDEHSKTGSCRVSKVVGPKYGVAKEVDVVIAKILKSMGSVIDAISKVCEFLKSKAFEGQSVAGYHVMTMTIHWPSMDALPRHRFELFLSILVKYYQVVVVFNAGSDPTRTNAEVSEWPAILSKTYDVITVGAVNAKTGKTYPWTPTGTGLITSAPGNVQCAWYSPGDGPIDYQQPYYKSGTDVAAAQVAGLVAYILSLPDEGPFVRSDPDGVPRAMKGLIRSRYAYIREGATEPAIWNLLGDNLPGVPTQPEE